MSDLRRCEWAGNDPHYVKYHDEEWGVPVHDDRKHFEFLILEGAQAGLSWITILRRRAGYRKAFAQFDPVKVAMRVIEGLYDGVTTSELDNLAAEIAATMTVRIWPRLNSSA